MRNLQTCTLMLAIGLLAACSSGGQGSRHSSVFQHLSIAGNGDVIVHARNGTDARITAAGDLDLDRKPVAVTPAQRPLLEAYHADALALRRDAIATGKAGAGLGLNALGTVAKGLASGDPDSIDKKLQPQADKVDALGQKVCVDLAALHAAQDKLVSALPAFQPYATIESHDASECHTVEIRP